MSDINGSVTREKKTLSGALLTVVRPEGTYELVREGSKITSAAFIQGAMSSKKLKASLKKNNAEVKKKSEERKKTLWSRAGQWASLVSDPSKVKSFLKAGASKVLEGPVSLAVLDHRHQCCHGRTLSGIQVSEPCEARMESEGKHYCKSCGCGEWKLAELDVASETSHSKLSFPNLACPLKRWSAVKGQNHASNKS